MPNNVTNIIKLQGSDEQIKKLLEEVRDDEEGIGSIDFNKLIPMPKELDITAGSVTDKGLRAYKDFVSVYTLEGGITGRDLLNIPKESENVFRQRRSDITDEEWNNGRTAFQNIIKYGAPTWYDWCIKNWNTKWNAYGFDKCDDKNVLSFQTAWSAPVPVIDKLAEKYPDLLIVHKWADEDIGNNCGERHYVGGVAVVDWLPETRKEAIEFAAGVMSAEPIDWGLYLNSTGTDYIYPSEDELDVIEVLGRKALFSNGRITDDEVPTGLHCYRLRESDDGDRFASLEPKVIVNFGGTVITYGEVDFGEKGYIGFTEDTEPNFLGGKMTIEDFLTLGYSNQEDLQIC